MDSKRITEFLKTHEISFRVIEHPPVYTVEEARNHRSGMEQVTHAKNLFLKDSKRKQYFLLSAEAESTARLSEIRKLLGAKKLSFASADELMEILNLEPGSVSPFGLLNDEEKMVHYLVDRQLWDAQEVAFHPNINTQTLVLSGKDFRRSIELMGYSPQVLTL
ncbi:MAG: prolyl-tRNA synthetase associated domain-containing protein [Candidatus Kariarchaeaceae archaeon]